MRHKLILACASVSFAASPCLAQDPSALFLHGSGPVANPPLVFLDAAAPSGVAASYRDSASVKFAGGNPWKEVGVWSASPITVSSSLIDLGDLRAWLGLKNSDDQGTRFDLRVEVYKAGSLISAGDAYCIQGVTRNPSLAREVAVPLALPSPVTFDGSTEELSLRVQARIGTNGAGASCGGHSNAVGVRLYFDAADRPARLSTTFAAASQFSPTGGMMDPRLVHTATLLEDGKVLIAGGSSNFDVITPATVYSSAELYDPATGTFARTDSMASARHWPSATRLNDGKVLITGGFNGSTSEIASAELYDPATHTFSATSSMSIPRYTHTATLLDSGMVLIAGGWSGHPGGMVASAELYDPATGTFTPTGSMTRERSVHTATLLNDGRVLIAGGTSGTEYVASAELYDPATGTFVSTGSMTRGAEASSATLLNDGRVLIAGGWTPGPGPSSRAELYDPTTGTFTVTGSLAEDRYAHTGTLLDSGMVLMAGGRSNSGALASGELYDPTTGTFAAAGSMADSRMYHTATLFNDGSVLMVGGAAPNPEARASAELYTPTSR